ncbi:MAG: hypothetical protein ACE5JL_15435, partial [Dehalococcoidia bacterium]
MRHLIRGIFNSGLVRGEGGATAIFLLLAFMVLAVPIAQGAIVTAGQLSRNSRVYDDRLTAFYAAGAGVEAALWEVLNDPSFGDGLTCADPSTIFPVEINGQIVTVTITRLCSGEPLQGQSIIVTKTVDLPTAGVGDPTTFSYTITIKNEGTGVVEINQVYDYLPPGLTYIAGSTTGLTTTEPTITSNESMTCGNVPDELFWNVQPESITIGAEEELTLSFQATGTLFDGTYYNQAAVRYDP